MGMRILMRAFIVLLLGWSHLAFAQAYGLRNLRPEGLSQQLVTGARRQLLHFKNELGDHFLLYEENAAAGGVPEIAGLAHFLGNPSYVCSIDLDCRAKAFCTGDCRKLYYEIFNTAAPAGRNSCTIKAFSCSQPGGGV